MREVVNPTGDHKLEKWLLVTGLIESNSKESAANCANYGLCSRKGLSLSQTDFICSMGRESKRVFPPKCSCHANWFSAALYLASHLKEKKKKKKKERKKELTTRNAVTYIFCVLKQ